MHTQTARIEAARQAMLDAGYDGTFDPIHLAKSALAAADAVTEQTVLMENQKADEMVKLL